LRFATSRGYLGSLRKDRSSSRRRFRERNHTFNVTPLTPPRLLGIAVATSGAMNRDGLQSVSDFGHDLRAIRGIPILTCDEYATKVSGLLATIEIATELVTPEQIREDALARIEGKVDAVIEALIAVQRRIDSIDAVFARIVAR